MRNKIWTDQHILFEGHGLRSKPIVLEAETPGRVILSGNSTLRIAGSYLTVAGLLFKKGYADQDVIAFRSGSDQAHYCRITSTVIQGYNPPRDTMENRWVSLYGTFNRVDHCFLEGKNNQGPTLVVWLDGHPNYHLIDHNYFGHRPDLGRNGGETIRVGTSTWSQTDSYTTVAGNYFWKCDGEIEAISNKSGHNTYRRNTFDRCRTTLTLRHGNYATVEDNVFLGGGEPESGGVRVIGSHHLVNHNYFQDLTGTGLRAAISVMNAQPHPELTGYWVVDSAVITNNIIVDCKQGIVMGSGATQKNRVVAPVNCVISDNSVYSKRSEVVKGTIPQAASPAETGPGWWKKDR